MDKPNYFADNQTQFLKGHFLPKDVHHQYGITFHTPPFPDKKITENVPAKMYLYKPSDSSKSNEIDFLFKQPLLAEENNFVQPVSVTQRAGNLKRNKATVRASNNQEEESDSSSN